MTEWLAFEGTVVPLVRGRATYTILPLPGDVAAALAAAGARRVEGEIADHPVNLALARDRAVEGAFLWTGRSLLDRIGIKPGARVEMRVRPAPGDAVETPHDIAAALRAAGLAPARETLAAGRRRGHIHSVDVARTPAARARRIPALAAEMGGAP